MSALIHKTLKLISIILLTVGSAAIFAQEDSGLVSTLRPVLRYPPSLENQDEEGMVLVRYMVDQEGKVFEPSIYRSTGHPAFQEEALKAVASSRWRPAVKDGQPVMNAAFYLAIFYDTDEDPSVNFAFRRRYDAVVAAIADDNQQQAAQLLEELENYPVATNFEHVLLNLTRYSYYRRYGGSELQLMQYLDAALFFESSYRSRSSMELAAESMPVDVLATARRNLFMLQVNNRRYVEALKTYELMLEGGQDVSEFETASDRILALTRDDSAYAVADVVPDSGSWNIMLAKRGFYVESPDGGITEIKLRCLHNIQTFQFSEGAEYRIPASWANCSLEIKGNPGAQIHLEQFG
ncbi:energy transducer TonB [Pseudohongiella sp. O18]|uniref:energy transducer TonB n=1 Tax=Pseudohongiella sp. O18 TaxID=2904248 RepID=UPI001F2103B5|nr:energy transducer TonB [Pseudohongiella sp. O18]